jgi:hypothetical protein
MFVSSWRGVGGGFYLKPIACTSLESAPASMDTDHAAQCGKQYVNFLKVIRSRSGFVAQAADLANSFLPLCTNCPPPPPPPSTFISRFRTTLYFALFINPFEFTPTTPAIQ